VSRYLESVIQQECPEFDDATLDVLAPAERLFLSKQPTYFDPSVDPHFAKTAFKSDVHHVVTRCQMHVCKKVCYKYGSLGCRFCYPRPLVLGTSFNNGAIMIKRLSHWCNNYNRSMSAVLRCNVDVKFITNGRDARASIFYTTNYITKSELSAFESVSLIKVAMDKIDVNLYPTKVDPNLTANENRARRRIFTALNVLDAHVERSSQWCSHSLLGYPLEYKSHRFCSFNAYTFVNEVNNASVTNADEPSIPETTVPILAQTGSRPTLPSEKVHKHSHASNTCFQMCSIISHNNGKQFHVGIVRQSKAGLRLQVP
jgi:hypothetical protein